MAPLVVLVAVTLTLLAAGAAGIRRLRSWPVALRGGLAAMFALTGGAHFIGMRDDLVAIVPPFLPEPALLVTVTGILELAGAVGLLVAPFVRATAGGLAVLLLVMFPANAYAALEAIPMNGAPPMPLLPRALMQLVFLSATVAVLVHARSARARRLADTTQPAPDT